MKKPAAKPNKFGKKKINSVLAPERLMHKLTILNSPNLSAKIPPSSEPNPYMKYPAMAKELITSIEIPNCRVIKGTIGGRTRNREWFNEWAIPNKIRGRWRLIT